MNKATRRRRPPRRCTPRWHDRPPGIGRLVVAADPEHILDDMTKQLVFDIPRTAVLDEVAPSLTREQEDTLRTFIAPPVPAGWGMVAIRTPYAEEMP